MQQSHQDILKSKNTTLLPIPPRFQWENGHGYCGQTSIQSCSLYYGNYISQQLVRNIAQSQVLIGENAEPTLNKLGYLYQSWDSQNHKKPQYKDFLQWIKKNIEKGYPVIIAGYEPKGKNQEYDHIYLAVGVHSKNYQSYSGEDYLIYADLFDQEYTITAFDKVTDTRAMNNNGKHLDFAIPQDICYGVAIKGIADQQKQFLPVRLILEQNSEPNVSVGQQSCIFSIKIQIFQLKKGQKYALLRYNNPKNLPKNHVHAAAALKVTKFTANAQTHELQDTVESSAMAFYRCVEEADLS